ncbi:Txe/YoeB family addiction module toxin [Candidatus Aquiluna sp. UB-MaderosW2red]|jgi:toxin YoeB|uniref:Txe/YoeB family addiction module toxin n=1 Tax=Candidatus Aquiluna sp. UB-MaderosW2red TaxID=1855377 RepID=UPI000875EBC6|nr:Txe/YoeB family addiction module toxin [Candidatus Aquiluna sp. UB-MaderosW2red]SCX04807.1 toxin YoeB [Candidatus Aquiluna sp. UB-MaderosW2red]
MKLSFEASAWEDLQWWIEHDRRIAKQIRKLLDAVLRQPREGIGKPEPLRGLGAEIFSRRITLEHRLVYGVLPGEIKILSCRHHY